MRALELKIPPPIVALLCAAVMWGIALQWPGWAWQHTLRGPLALALAVCGLACDASGLIAFGRHRTTINPLAPDRSTTIVQDGIYRYTRNPMYLGMALLLTAWAVWQANWLCLLVMPVFIAYIKRFQIMPEERILLTRFGEGYAQYLRTVRRWV